MEFRIMRSENIEHVYLANSAIVFGENNTRPIIISAPASSSGQDWEPMVRHHLSPVGGLEQFVAEEPLAGRCVVHQLDLQDDVLPLGTLLITQLPQELVED